MKAVTVRGLGTIRQRGRIWFVRYCRLGKQHEESSHSTERRMRSACSNTNKARRRGGAPVTPQPGKLTVADALKALTQDY